MAKLRFNPPPMGVFPNKLVPAAGWVVVAVEVPKRLVPAAGWVVVVLPNRLVPVAGWVVVVFPKRLVPAGLAVAVEAPKRLLPAAGWVVVVEAPKRLVPEAGWVVLVLVVVVPKREVFGVVEVLVEVPNSDEPKVDEGWVGVVVEVVAGFAPKREEPPVVAVDWPKMLLPGAEAGVVLPPAKEPVDWAAAGVPRPINSDILSV